MCSSQNAENALIANDSQRLCLAAMGQQSKQDPLHRNYANRHIVWGGSFSFSFIYSSINVKYNSTIITIQQLIHKITYNTKENIQEVRAPFFAAEQLFSIVLFEIEVYYFLFSCQDIASEAPLKSKIFLGGPETPAWLQASRELCWMAPPPPPFQNLESWMQWLG